MLYDPEDDLSSETFELERFVAVSSIHRFNRFQMKYFECDRKFIAYALKEKKLVSEAEILLKVEDLMLENHPYYVRAYIIKCKSDRFAGHKTWTNYASHSCEVISKIKRSRVKTQTRSERFYMDTTISTDPMGQSFYMK